MIQLVRVTIHHPDPARSGNAQVKEKCERMDVIGGVRPATLEVKFED